MGGTLPTGSAGGNTRAEVGMIPGQNGMDGTGPNGGCRGWEQGH